MYCSIEQVEIQGYLQKTVKLYGNSKKILTLSHVIIM